MLSRITPLVLTFNEEANIARTLSGLAWAHDVVVVDSGSSDATQAIARQFANVRVFERPFTTHAEQWNFGLTQTGIATEWVLALDADFLVSPSLVEELRTLDPSAAAGFEASFTYCIGGQPLRAAVYPPVTVLFQRDRASYRQDGHTQRVVVDGAVRPLANRILHDDRKPLRHWLASQSRYMTLEADKLCSADVALLPLVDRVRRWIVVAPLGVFWYCLLVKGGVRDGWRGVYYALQRLCAEVILSLNLLERRWRSPRDVN